MIDRHANHLKRVAKKKAHLAKRLEQGKPQRGDARQSPEGLARRERAKIARREQT